MGQSVSKDSVHDGELFIHSFLLGKHSSTIASCPCCTTGSCGNLDHLTDDVIPYFMTFNAPKELDLLAVTCKKLRYFVEIYAKDALKDLLKSIQKNYNVDPKWRARVQDLVKERRTFRHKLQFYLENKVHNCAIPSGTSVFLKPPGEDMMYTGGEDGGINKWDLKTQKCIQTFSERHDHRVDALALCNGNLVSLDRSCVKVWNMGGNSLYTLQVAAGSRLYAKMPVAVVGSNVFCLCTGLQNRFITEIDVSSGQFSQQLDQYDSRAASWERLFPVGNWLFCYGTTDGQEGIFRVLDGQGSPSRFLNLFATDYYTCLACSEEQDCLVGSNDGSLHFMGGMTRGYLYLLRLVRLPPEFGTVMAMLVHGSHVYVAPFSDTEHLPIYVLDLPWIGSNVSRMHYPSGGAQLRPQTLATDGHELFCSFVPHDSENGHDSIIMSFPLME